MIIYDPYEKVELDKFLPELVFAIPELPEDMAAYYIKKGAIEFARRSLAIRRKVRIRIQQCVENYILEAPDCMDVLAIHSICKVGGTGCCGGVTRLTHKPCKLCGCGTYAWREDPNIIRFHPSSECAEYEVEISVAPTMDACEVDSVFYTKYLEAVLNGARMFLYAIPRRAWSSQPQATDARHEFDRRVATASLETHMGGQVGAIRAKTRRVV